MTENNLTPGERDELERADLGERLDPEAFMRFDTPGAGPDDKPLATAEQAKQLRRQREEQAP